MMVGELIVALVGVLVAMVFIWDFDRRISALEQAAKKRGAEDG